MMFVTLQMVGIVGLNIALDYDSTYTADPELWDSFLEQTTKRGHKVYIVTSRYPQMKIEVVPKGITSIIYCSMQLKYEVTKALELPIDIWIDDNPGTIHKPVGVWTEEQWNEWNNNGNS